MLNGGGVDPTWSKCKEIPPAPVSDILCLENSNRGTVPIVSFLLYPASFLASSLWSLPVSLTKTQTKQHPSGLKTSSLILLFCPAPPMPPHGCSAIGAWEQCRRSIRRTSIFPIRQCRNQSIERDAWGGGLILLPSMGRGGLLLLIFSLPPLLSPTSSFPYLLHFFPWMASLLYRPSPLRCCLCSRSSLISPSQRNLPTLSLYILILLSIWSE